MNAKQHDWMRRMQANLDLLAEQYHTTGIDQKLKAETSKKILEASRRLALQYKFKVVDEKENAANHEFWDGEADAHVEWLDEHLRIIRIYTAEPDDYGDVDSERLYELEMDRRYHALHGGDPEWAQ